MSLKDKTIILTGAASGIGRETARVLHALEANLLLLDCNEEGLKSIKNELGEGVFYRVINLMEFDSIKGVLLEAKKEIGKSYTGLVHCAGIPSVLPLRALSNEQYEKVRVLKDMLAVNVKPLRYRDSNKV